MDLVPFIYHEQQDGLLCLQHAINNLLQGSYFNAVDLAEIARGLDEKELASLLEGHESNADAVTAKFHSEGSQNYNDTGFFSVQVLSEALQIWHLDIQRIGSQENVQVKRNPQLQTAFICNFEEHWLTLRRLGGSKDRWYNLNSTFKQPQHVSETYLGMFLDQLQTEGYTILVVTGILPNCTADNEAGLVPIPPPGSLKVVKKATVARNNSDSDDIARAIAMSLGNDNCDQVVDSDLDQAIKASMMDTDDDNLSVSHALAESLNQSSQSSSNAKRPAFQMAASAPSAAELEQIRLSRISRFSK